MPFGRVVATILCEQSDSRRRKAALLYRIGLYFNPFCLCAALDSASFFFIRFRPSR
jgi:hypothetical protein